MPGGGSHGDQRLISLSLAAVAQVGRWADHGHRGQLQKVQLGTELGDPPGADPAAKPAENGGISLFTSY